MDDPVVAKLLEIRNRERLSTAAMARRIGVDQSYLHLVFRGERGVGRKLLDGAIAAFPEVADAHARPLTIRHDTVADQQDTAQAVAS
jgi:transcriptional regulator with XRE-family HTH domain